MVPDSFHVLINVQSEEDGLPIYPTCFKVFKKTSIDQLSMVDSL